MRALLIGVFGGVVGLVSFGLSRVGGGLLGGGAFVVALFMIPLTTGMVIAALFAAWQESPRPARIHLGQHTSPSRTRERCGSCRRKMTQVGQIWICSVCDGVAVEY